MGDPTKMEPVERDEKGRVKSGGLNPGGLTAIEREARDAVRQALSGELREVGLAAYRRLLEADNPLIVKDFMDRVAGKVKERVELSADPEVAAPLADWSLHLIEALARDRAEKAAKVEDAHTVK